MENDQEVKELLADMLVLSGTIKLLGAIMNEIKEEGTENFPAGFLMRVARTAENKAIEFKELRKRIDEITGDDDEQGNDD